MTLVEYVGPEGQINVPAPVGHPTVLLSFPKNPDHGDRRLEEFPTRDGAEKFCKHFNTASNRELFRVPTDLATRAEAEALANSGPMVELRARVEALEEAVAALQEKRGEKVDAPAKQDDAPSRRAKA